MTRRSEKKIAQSLAKNSPDTTLSVSSAGKRVALLPHERDETTDGQTSSPRKVMQQAVADIANGLKDTDRSAQVNQTYQKLKTKP